MCNKEKTVSYSGNEYRVIVIRSKYGNYPYYFYELPTTAKIGGPEYNALKKLYSSETGCPYCEVSPMSLEKWLSLDPDDYKRTCTTIK